MLFPQSNKIVSVELLERKQMTQVSILGSIGTLIGLIRALPQFFRLYRAREAFGVSVDTAATSSIVSFGWAAYGFLTSQAYVSFATGSSGVIFALITILALRFGRKVNEFRVAPLWLGVVILAGLFGGKIGLGIALPISVLAANIPQLLVAYKEGNLTDLSLGTWLLSIADGLVWGIYSLIQRDFSIMIFALFQLTTSGLIVMLKLSHKKKNDVA
ncbi:MAG: hypothetical protein WCK35_16040 [Chloroflexota bacterium]